MTAPEQMRADVRLLLENGFRNIDLPPLDDRDLADIAGALDSIAALSTRPATDELVEALGFALEYIDELINIGWGGEIPETDDNIAKLEAASATLRNARGAL